MNTLPEEIIINHILPYTYNVKNKDHLIDIRSFTSDLGVLENVYWFEFKNIKLLNDLEIFIYETNEYIFSRFISMNGKNILEVRYHEIMYFKDNKTNTERKIILIWGILTPVERTRFINKYIID